MRAIAMESSSCYTKRLSRGCRLCRKGSKMVLLVTGKCGQTCYYCPLSEAKKGRDVVYANERPVQEDGEVIEEALSIGARGTGVTGGDPLAVMDRTVHYITLLKERFRGRAPHAPLHPPRWTGSTSGSRTRDWTSSGCTLRFGTGPPHQEHRTGPGHPGTEDEGGVRGPPPSREEDGLLSTCTSPPSTAWTS